MTFLVSDNMVTTQVFWFGIQRFFHNLDHLVSKAFLVKEQNILRIVAS